MVECWIATETGAMFLALIDYYSLNLTAQYAASLVIIK